MLLFSAPQPLTIEQLLECINESLEQSLSEADIEQAIAAMREDYQDEDATVQLHFTGGGWQLLSKPAYHHTLSRFFKQQSNRKLSRAALETLSIIAYRQPISRPDIEAIRGVSCDYAINKLLERELIAIAGRDPGPGRPLLYSTSPQFMDYFGLADLSDLPKLKELMPTDNSIGEVSES